jgi:hypothetical protein
MVLDSMLRMYEIDLVKMALERQKRMYLWVDVFMDAYS